MRPARSPSRCSSSSSPRAIARASRPSAVELSAFRSGGSRTTATSASLPPAGSIAFSTAFAIPGSRPPRATSATRWSRSRPADDRREHRLVEVALGPELALQRVDLRRPRVEVGLQAPLDVVGGAGDDVGAEPDADQDPDREREEHGGQRGRVVASRVPHQRFSSDLDLQPDEVEELRQRRRAQHDDHDQRQRDQQERPHVPAADAGVVEAAHALGVDQRLADPQPGEEGRRHPGAVLVHELGQVEVRADGDDQLGAVLVREQHRHVLARADRRGDDGVEAEPLQALPARGAAVGVGVDDDLRAAGERGVGGRVHVAEDHVRLEALLDDRVGAAVDADEHRVGVLDVGAQRAQVAAVGRAANDDQRVPVAEVRPDRREVDLADQQLALVAHVFDRVHREVGERLVDALALALDLLGGGVEVDHPPRGELRPVRAQRAPPRSPPGRRRRAPRRAAPRGRRSASRRPARGRAAPGSGSARWTTRATLTTAATPHATRSSAAIRSRSAWSMIAISPGASRLTRSLVRRPSRVGPVIVGTAPGCSWISGPRSSARARLSRAIAVIMRSRRRR